MFQFTPRIGQNMRSSDFGPVEDGHIAHVVRDREHLFGARAVTNAVYAEWRALMHANGFSNRMRVFLYEVSFLIFVKKFKKMIFNKISIKMIFTKKLKN